MSLVQDYIKSSFVGPKTLELIESRISDFKIYVERFPIKVSVCLSGSYSTGLACRDKSAIDLIVCMDGGVDTDPYLPHQLASALMEGIKDWSSLVSVAKISEQSSTIRCDVVECGVSINLHTYKPTMFPCEFLRHSLLFSSYALCDSRFAVTVVIIKQWAADSGFSVGIPSRECPLSGFHWTLLATFFLIELGIVPNLHIDSQFTHALKREQYGPILGRDSFALISDVSACKKIRSKPANTLTVDAIVLMFIEWIASIDLLSYPIRLQEAGIAEKTHRPKGWIILDDPVKHGFVNTIDVEQKYHVTFAMRLRRYAGVLFAEVKGKGADALVESIRHRTRHNRLSTLIDKSVP